MRWRAVRSSKAPRCSAQVVEQLDLGVVDAELAVRRRARGWSAGGPDGAMLAARGPARRAARRRASERAAARTDRRAPARARNPRHLLVDLDRLGFLTDRGERLREQRERVEVAAGRPGSRSAAWPAPACRLRACRAADRAPPRRARSADRHAEMQDALDTLSASSRRCRFNSELGRRPERVDRLVQRLDAAAGLGEAQVRQRVGRVELDHLAEDLDRVAIACRPFGSRVATSS